VPEIGPLSPPHDERVPPSILLWDWELFGIEPFRESIHPAGCVNEGKRKLRSPARKRRIHVWMYRYAM